MVTVFLALFLAVGGVLIGMSIPLIQRKVAPNPWYGFRVRRTLADRDVWYAANEYAARRMLWVGVATTVAAVAAYFVPGLGLAAYASVVFVVAAGGLVIALVQSFTYLRRLTDAKTRR